MMTRSRLSSNGVLFCFNWHHVPGQVVLRKLSGQASAGLIRALCFPFFKPFPSFLLMILCAMSGAPATF